MLRYLSSLIVLSLIASNLPAQSYFSYVPERRFEFEVSKDALKKSPPWDDHKENPPVSARRAIELAVKLKNSLVKDTEGFKWELKNASLVPVRDAKWIWLVTFELLPVQANLEGQAFTLRVPVLMDGSAVTPKV